MTEFDFLICIGRCNPVHQGHMFLFKDALKKSSNLIIILGSAECAISPHDPFTLEERIQMLKDSFAEDPEINQSKKIWIIGIPDYSGDDKWVARVQSEVDDIVWQFDNADVANIGLIGFEKDAKTSSYLRKFPQWERVKIDSQFSTINATQIRDAYLRKLWHLPQLYHAPAAVSRFMEQFAHTLKFKWLVNEAEYLRTYNPRDFDNDAVACADAVVVQSGHILLGRRKNAPGKGLLALPGGHVNNKDVPEKGIFKETFRECAVRELREESQISDSLGKIPPGRLDGFIVGEKFCDNPNRSLRARVISMAYLFRLPDGPLYHVKGSDDMESEDPNEETMKWYSLANINLLQREFFEDHFLIIQDLLKL